MTAPAASDPKQTLLRQSGRREFFKRTLALSAFTGTLWHQKAYANQVHPSIIRGPYLVGCGKDIITVCWRTSAACLSEVVCRSVDGVRTVSASGTVPTTEHRLVVSGLSPATSYSYEIRGADSSGTTYTASNEQLRFRTAPSAADKAKCRFWALGDCGSHPSAPWGYPESIRVTQQFMNSSAAAGKSIDALVLLGDNAYHNGSDSEYQAAVFNKYTELLRRTPVWSTFGNHDAYTLPYPFTGAAPYDAIFSGFPQAGECGGVPSGSLRYYSFEHGPVHFICLDDNTDGYYDRKPGDGGMVDWLLADLKACTSDWIIAFFHHPPYSRGTHESDTQWHLARVKDHIVPILERYGVDLVLCGHSHQYQRSFLLDGHYGKSATYVPATMCLNPGRGSDKGSADAQGVFQPSLTDGGGVYEKNGGSGRAGAVYVVIGSSGKVDAWPGGVTTVVNPTPYPVHVTNLMIIGGIVVDIQGDRLDAEYRDEAGATRDHFAIVKRSQVELVAANPLPVTRGKPEIRLELRRRSASSTTDSAVVIVRDPAKPASEAVELPVSFPSGSSTAEVTFSPAFGNGSGRYEFSIKEMHRPPVAGSAARRVQWQEGVPLLVTAALSPADEWYAARFGAPPENPSVWDQPAGPDGMSALLKYALGGEPGRDDSALMPGCDVNGDSLQSSFVRPVGRTDVKYVFEKSGDLQVWEDVDDAWITRSPVETGGERWTCSIPLLPGSQFIRLDCKLTVPA